jgi:repressor of nif and glnA expression
MNLKEEFKVKGTELLEEIKKIINEGNVRHIVIKDGKGQKYLDIPITVGVVGVVLAPFLAGIAALTVLATDITIEVTRNVN